MNSLFLVSGNANDTLSMKARTVFIPKIMMPSYKIDSASGAKILGSTSNGGMNVLLAANEGAKLHFGSGYAAIKQLTTACHGINATIFTPPGRPYAWYGDLNNKLNIIKSYANEWITEIAVDVTSTIPASITTYNNTFQSHIKVIQNVVSKYPDFDDIPDSDLQGIRGILRRLIEKVDTVSDNWTRCKNRMDKWKGEVDVARNIKTGISGAKYDLQEGSSNIQKAASELAVNIEKYQVLIESLQKEIEDYRKMVGLGGGLVGGGIASAAIGTGLCFVFPVVGGIMLVLGIGMIAGGAAVWGIFQKKINDAYADISKYRQYIVDDGATLTSLGSLSTASESVVSNAQTAIEKMTDVQTIWSAYGESLKAVNVALENGKKEAMAALITVETEDAKKQWNTLANYSQELLASTDEVKIIEGNQKIAA